MLKKMSIGVLCFLLCSGLLCVLDTYATDANSQEIQNGQNLLLKNEHRVSYESHSPISISDDNDFIEQSILGSGTEEEPYIIENLEIVDDDSCAYIVH